MAVKTRARPPSQQEDALGRCVESMFKKLLLEGIDTTSIRCNSIKIASADKEWFVEIGPPRAKNMDEPSQPA